MFVVKLSCALQSRYSTILLSQVLGKRNANQLGRTLTHEHLSMNYEMFYIRPPDHLKRFLDGKIELQNVGVLKQYP